jgi:AcrR family transcriptional regulator
MSKSSPDDKSSEIYGVRERVLAAGRAEFAQHGLVAGSVRSIGERAGVTAAMINYYFGGKRALYDAVVAEAQGRLTARVSAALAASTGGGPAARLAGAYFDFLAEDQELQRLLLREVLDRGDGVRELAARYVAPLRAQLAQHFGEGDEAAQRAISLFGAVAGYFLYEPILGAFLGADPHGPDALARRRQHVVRLATLLEEMPR